MAVDAKLELGWDERGRVALSLTQRVASTVGRKKLSNLTRSPRPIVGALAPEVIHITSYGSAAPTFGRAKLNLVASHKRPKVGATREIGTRYIVIRDVAVHIGTSKSVRLHL